MSSTDPTGTDWTNQEIDLIVRDYFDMLGSELARRPYVKLHHNNALQQQIRRSHRSIEFKHQNISAVLRKLGLPWILGYKPKEHYQNALIDGIERFLAAGSAFPAANGKLGQEFAEEGIIRVDPAPMLRERSVDEPLILKRLIRRFDPAERDERNRALGRRGEERVLESERARLRQADRTDLANKIRWISQEEGDGAGYDILSFTESGDERLLEVKTTTGYELTPFYLSANERSLSVERPNDFRIFRLYDFARDPKAFEIAPPLENALILEAANYRASFG
jgi:Domain of unknown function (DUF3883)